MDQDPLFELGELRGRFEAKLLAEQSSMPSIDSEGFGVSATPVEGCHQGGDEPLA
jgi:hypothetical protein